MSEEKIFRLQYWGRQHGKTNAQVRDIADRLIEFFKGAEIKAEISAKSVDYDQLLADARELQKALEFYAKSKHFQYCGKEEFEPETVSGEPDNWESGGAENSEFEFENGGYARFSLETFTKKYGSAE